MEKKEKLEVQFHELVKAHKSTIYSVCYMFSNDPDEVNDLFQDSLINIWKGLGSYAGQSSLKTWLWRITLNTCISAGRKKKLKKVPLDMNVNLFEDRDAQSLAAGEAAARPHTAPATLRPRHRAAVAREHKLRGDRPDCGHLDQECIDKAVSHTRAAQKHERR